MQPTSIAKRLTISALCCGLFWQPVQADEERRAKGRSGLDDLSQEMSTCAAYFSLLSSIVQKSVGADSKTNVADGTGSASAEGDGRNHQQRPTEQSRGYAHQVWAAL